jgi:uncharacterized protein YpuA (DUF1002 family)
MTSFNTDALLNKLDQVLFNAELQDNGAIRDRVTQLVSESGVNLSDDTFKNLLASLTKTSLKPDPTTADMESHL